MIGDVVSIQHLEPIGNIHFSHSFVRGNWRNEKESTPCLLSKSCHDLDIIYWILGKKCTNVSSFGALNYFKEEYAPAGSTQMCTEGCLVENECPYSAKRIYYSKREWGVSYLIDLQPWDENKVLKAINEGPYGNVSSDVIMMWLIIRLSIWFLKTISLLHFQWKHIPVTEAEEQELWAQKVISLVIQVNYN